MDFHRAGFPLLDLPLDLIERVISHTHSSILARFYRTSKLLKEISNQSWLWRKRIYIEKQKIICVPSPETDWRRIFFKSIQFVTLQQAVKHVEDSWKQSKSARWRMILAPGVYPIFETIMLLPTIDIQGLFDTPWSQKPASQITKLVGGSKNIFKADPKIGEDTEAVISIKNISIETNKKGKDGRVACSLKKGKYLIENCEFRSLSASALYLSYVGERTGRLLMNYYREASVTVKDCRFHDSAFGIFLSKDSEVNATGCIFSKNGEGIHASGCKRSVILERCSFLKTKTGIIMCRSGATSIIKNCRIAGSEERGIIMRPGSDALLFENQITNNAIGLAVFETATIGLSKNIVLNNKKHGVVMRYDVQVDFITDNQIKNNGVTGLSMSEYCAETRFTVDELCRTNVITDNKTNVVLYPPRPKYEILYKPGDTKEVLSSNCALALSRNMCTFAATQINMTQQASYECYTCGQSTICVTCAKRCHTGHILSTVTSSTFYCDCGAENQCQALHVLEPSV